MKTTKFVKSAWTLAFVIPVSFTTSSLGADASLTEDAHAAQQGLVDSLGMKRVWVETHVSITWSDDKPVVGAKVFDHRTNTLLGVTDGTGRLLLTVINGTVLRLVEPTYGQQQSLRIVQGKQKTNKEMMSATSTSNYSAGIVDIWIISG